MKKHEKRLQVLEVQALKLSETHGEKQEYLSGWQASMISANPQSQNLIAMLQKEAGTQDARALILHRYDSSELEAAREELNKILISHILTTKTAPVSKVIRAPLPVPNESEHCLVRHPETGDFMLFMGMSKK